MAKHLEYAVTLTTGDEYNPLVCNCICKKFNDLLFDYRKYFTDFQFHLEILDKNYMETKIHFHGFIIVPVRNIQRFQKFIRTWKKDYFVCVKLVTDMEKWHAYITKQNDVIRIGYPELKQIMYKPRFLRKPGNKLKCFLKDASRKVSSEHAEHVVEQNKALVRS